MTTRIRSIIFFAAILLSVVPGFYCSTIEPPDRFYSAENQRYITFNAESLILFRLDSNVGSVEFYNSADDSVRIMLDISVSSKISTEDAEQYLGAYSFEIDNAGLNTAEITSSFNLDSPEVDGLIDLVIELPEHLNVYSHTNIGDQLFNLNIPNNDQGSIEIRTDVGDINCYIPNSASAQIIVEVSVGEINYEQFLIDNLTHSQTGAGANLTGSVGSGTGGIYIYNEIGNVFLRSAPN